MSKNNESCQNYEFQAEFLKYIIPLPEHVEGTEALQNYEILFSGN